MRRCVGGMGGVRVFQSPIGLRNLKRSNFSNKRTGEYTSSATTGPLVLTVEASDAVVRMRCHHLRRLDAGSGCY